MQARPAKVGLRAPNKGAMHIKEGVLAALLLRGEEPGSPTLLTLFMELRASPLLERVCSLSSITLCSPPLVRSPVRLNNFVSSPLFITCMLNNMQMMQCVHGCVQCPQQLMFMCCVSPFVQHSFLLVQSCVCECMCARMLAHACFVEVLTCVLCAGVLECCTACT